MKSEVSLKRILAILIIVLVCLVSIGGVYVKNKNVMKNVLPDYVLGMDLDTKTIVKLDVEKNENNSSEDAQGQATEENKEENKYTLDNYKKSKNIIEKRLKTAGIEQYSVRLDDSTGAIVLEIPENVDKSLLQGVFSVGKTEIKISSTVKTDEQSKEKEVTSDTEVTPETEENADNNKNKEEVIGNYKSIKNITAAIDNSYEGYGIGSFVKIDIEFSKDMVKKINELKNSYVIPTNPDGSQADNNIEIVIDGTSICTMPESQFLESTVDGVLPLKFGDYTKDKKQLDETLKEAEKIKNIIENGDLPLTFTASYSNEIHSDINEYGVISVFAVILAVMLAYLLFKYKQKGLFAELTILGFGAFLLLIVRYMKVQISIATIVAIAGMLIVQFIYLIKLLSNNKISSKVFNEKTIDFTKMLIPAFILSIVGAVLPALKNSSLMPFGNILEISDFGMILFWGILLFELFNNVITRAILTNAKNK